jgi:hypothetical protein
MDDALELELRQLAGVRFVASVEREGSTFIEVGLTPGFDRQQVRLQVERLAEHYLSGGIEVEVIDAAAPQPATSPQPGGPPPSRDPDGRREDVRVRLVSAAPCAPHEQTAYELHLSYRDGTVVVSSPAGDLRGVAAATLDGLRRLGLSAPFAVVSVGSVAMEHDQGKLVVLLDETTGGERWGLAGGTHPEESVARAVLNALNRYLQPRPPQPPAA